jgi:hypothetical protein
MLILAGILLVGGTAAWVLAPLVLRIAAPMTDGSDVELQIRELEALKDVAYETLRDVEFDYHAGKIGESDYRAMTERYTREATDLLQQLDALRARRPQPEGPRRGGS